MANLKLWLTEWLTQWQHQLLGDAIASKNAALWKYIWNARGERMARLRAKSFLHVRIWYFDIQHNDICRKESNLPHFSIIVAFKLLDSGEREKVFFCSSFQFFSMLISSFFSPRSWNAKTSFSQSSHDLRVTDYNRYKRNLRRILMILLIQYHHPHFYHKLCDIGERSINKTWRR